MTTLLTFARRYLTPYLHWYAVGVVCLAATNWLSVTIPMYLAQGIDLLTTGGDKGAVLGIAGKVALMGVAVIVVRTVSRLLFFTPGRLVEARVRGDLFHRILLHQPAYLSRWPTGDLVSRLTSDMNMVRLLAGFTALGIVNTVVALSMTFTQMLRISPTLAAVVTVPLLVGFGITIAVVGQLRAIMMEVQEAQADLSDHVLSTYQGVATVHAFGAEQALMQRFDLTSQRWLSATLRRANLRIAIGPVLSLAAAINVYLLLAIGGPMAIEGTLTVGELVAFTTLVAYLAGPLRGLSFIVSLFKQSQASLERIDLLLLEPPLRPEGSDGAAPPAAPPAIEARALSFRYPAGSVPDDPDDLSHTDEPPGRDAEVLHGLSFTVPAGGTLGVFGPTGSGKTTLLRLLSRLYNPPRGTLFVDGVDVLDLDLDDWRQVMTMVPQRAFLFSESLADNILLGAQGDEARAHLADTLKRAALDVDLEALTDGVETVVGEAGLTLSGGQRQRTALARGLQRGSRLLMLDDVLSAVDHHTEQQLIASLQAQQPAPTTVIVAHRLSALAHAHVIVVLDGGRQVDTGTHAELVARPGLYRDTWLRQADDGEAA